MSVLNLQDKKLLRLQLYLAKCGVASRRCAEQIILDGRVKVNGQKIVTLGTKVSLEDEVTVDDKKIVFENEIRYVLLNKPAGYICSLSDEKGRLVAADLLKQKYCERLYNVGRLDMFSSGLIIFTNDGEFTRLISHPSSQIEKEYVIEASTNIPDELIENFLNGIRIDNIFYRCKKAMRINTHKISVVLIEGKNREIRKVFEKYGLGIKSLQRIRIGNIKIENLQIGDFRDLSKKEIRDLKELCNFNGGFVK
ncbi:MAG: pseudouridine synthase [Treponemataceae bacterium]